MTTRTGRLLTHIDRAGGGFVLDLFLYAVSAAFALVTALTSTLLPHRAWGWIAVWAYLAGFVLALVQYFVYRANPARDFVYRRNPARAALAWLVWAGAAIVPLIVEAIQRASGRTDRAQEEVLVVEQMGDRLLHHGTPYQGRDAIAALPADDRLMAYSPYQPGMAVFGLPRAIAGDFWWTDARVWFAVVTVGALAGAVRLLGPTRSVTVRAIQAATVLPICALTLATGGDDIPVLALCLLAFALVATGHYGWAGVAAGAAAACKPFAFPVVAVLVVLALAARRGRSLLPVAIGLPILVLIPPLLVDAGAFTDNVVRFPIGHGLVKSPAESPFPGYLITQDVPGGRIIALGLLVAVAVLITVRIIRRPPRTATEAAVVSGLGLLAAILLLPTTRFGYLLYPIAFLVWAAALAPSTKPLHSNHTVSNAPGDDTALYRQ